MSDRNRWSLSFELHRGAQEKLSVFTARNPVRNSLLMRRNEQFRAHFFTKCREAVIDDGMKEREGRVGECILSDLVGKWKVAVISLSDAAVNRWELRKYPHSNYMWLYRTYCVFHVTDVMTKCDTS